MRPGGKQYNDPEMTPTQKATLAVLSMAATLERLVTAMNEVRESIDAVGERLANSMEGPS